MKNGIRGLAGIIPGIIGAGILTYKLLGVHGINLDPGLLLLPAAAVPAGLALTVLAKRQGRRSGGVVARQCKLYYIREADYRSLERMARFLEDRSRRGLARYVTASYYSSTSISSFLLICGSAGLVEREAEVFESFLSVFEGVRVEPAGYIEDSFTTTLELRAEPRGWPGPAVQAEARRELGGEEQGILLGVRIDTPLPQPVYLSRRDIEGHVGVFGSTGAGKSTTLRTLSARLAGAGFRVIILDWTGEHRLPGFQRIDPSRGELPLDPVSVIGDAGVVVEIMTQALGLTDPQAYLLQQVLSGYAPSSVRELASLLDTMPEEAKWDREVKRALSRKLWPMLRGGLAFEPQANPTRVPSGPAIVDLSGIASVRARRAYALTLLALEYMRARESRTTATVVVVDEAHNLLSGESLLLEEILSEARKFGLHIVYATQSPSNISNKIINNTNTKIVHRLTSLQDKEYIERAMANVPAPLDKLAPGEAVLQSISYPEPILVKVKPGGEAGDKLGNLRVREPIHPDTGFP